MSSTEARRDPLTGRWILVATAEAPEREIVVTSAAVPLAKVTVDEAPSHDYAPDPVLDRKSPVDRTRLADGLYTAATSAGRHEQIVESVDAPLESLDHATVAATLRLYRDRMLELADDNRTRFFGVTKAHGAAAGATTEGATSEVFALPFVPDAARQILTAFFGHHRKTGACVLCDMIRFERNEKVRIVEDGLRHVALCPWASANPFEILIAPKGHHPSFLAASDADLEDAAGLLARTLSRLTTALDGPAYRYVLRTAPPDAGADAKHFHWHFAVRPIVTARAALDELLPFNPVAPEHAAARLVKVEP
ncbi:MAG: hypothetical protein RMA76_41640 [Deltaproteobacteria bacterium]|jgi:UDPglucose--hexose-1-phosphate uridylyltransferase